VARAEPPFGIASFANHTIGPAEAPFTVAGGHPDLSVTELSVSGAETLNGTYINPPLGFVGNPAAAPRCPISKVPREGAQDTCPQGSRVGVAVTQITNSTSTAPLYNLPPEQGYPAQFGFRIENTPTVISVFPQSRTDSYGLTVGAPNAPAVGAVATRITLFGIPSQYGSGATNAPFLSNPLDCSEAEPSWSIAIDSQQHAGALRELGVPDLSDPDWKTDSELTPPVTECDNPALAEQFAGTTMAVKPLQGGGPVQADAPSGLAVDLDFPQSNDPTDPANATFDPSIPQDPEPKDITVRLPAGLSISPSSADGLGACSDLASDPAGDQVHYDDTKPVSCPDSAKIGSAVAISPLLATHDPVTDEVSGAEPIPGDVYLLKPHPGDLPTGGGNQEGKFRLLIQLENPRYGINFKLPGIAVADKNTGQLTTVFTDNPQLPASHVTVTLKGGPWASLATPVTCGAFTTTANFVPWSTPGTPDANKSTSFDVGSGPGGSGCADNPARRPFAPTMSAGTESSKAGASTPFLLRIARNDGEGELSSLDLTTPPGLTAKLAGVPYCSDAAIAAASSRSGATEQASPSCPAGSQIGTLAADSGPGPNPYRVNGRAYLAGPYKGAPLSFVFIAPAVAGPFDLGNVVVRAGVFVDPQTARMTISSDPLPWILDGMPLRLRSIVARLDRHDFTRNPTRCEPMAVSATVSGVSAAKASLSNGFQVGGCKGLGFKPRLALRLLGPTHRSAFPKVRATLTPRAGDANIARASVTLPATEFLENAHIQAICTRARYAAAACPPKSIYGRAKAWSPLLDRPLEGPVYLRASDRTLPDLAASLDGQFQIDAVGRIDSVRGRIRATLEALPDVPISKFVLTMDGGRKGLLVNNTELCQARPRVGALLEGQNGRVRSIHPLVRAACGRK
jgi:hypothetical protein